MIGPRAATGKHPFVRNNSTLEERAQGVVSVLRTNAAKLKDLDLDDLKRGFKDVNWKALRDVPARGAKDAVEGIRRMRRDDAAERRNGVMFVAVGAAIGAVLMYLFDPGNGSSRRSWARERLGRSYLRVRGQLDRSRRGPRSEGHGFDLTEKAEAGADRLGEPGRGSREDAAALSR